MPTDSPILDVAVVFGSPGASRRLALGLPVPGDLDLPLVRLDEPIALDGVVEGMVDGVVVRGTVRARAEAACGRCLTAVGQEVEAPVAELFADPADVEDPEDIEPGYAIADGLIDLDTLLRDALVAAVPAVVHCRPDCAGLCPSCGVDRNTTTCGCGDEVRDTRWTALEGLRVPPAATA